MRHILIAAIASLGLAAHLSAMDSTEMAASMPLNSTCVMCGAEVGKSPSLTKITVGEGGEAKTYYVACEGKTCSDAFAKDPAPVLKKVFSKDAIGFKTGAK